MQRPFPERNRDAHGAGQRFPDHSKTPNHPITQRPKRQTTTQLKQCYGRAGPTISRTSAAACIVCRDRIYIPPLQHLIMPGRLAEDHP
ncbi:MAG TPA: hypothetical protein ACQGQJ_11520 [Xylella fastidiosa subsp. multiplex]